MHLLLQRVTHLPWRQMFQPLVPALLCATGVGLTVLGVEYAMRVQWPSPNAWWLVGAQTAAAAAFVTGFALFAPLTDLRSLVLEMSETLMPKRIRLHPWAQAYLTGRLATMGEAKPT